jgi:Concanavalin A-like lectin/glucanases superfamily/Immunoglobulin I-set domain
MYSGKMRLIGLAVLFWAGYATAAIVPSTNDLWDISQGSVVTGTSGSHVPYSDIRDMFGGTFSPVEPGTTVFNDGQPPGFVHYVEWQTPAPVTVASFNLFGFGDATQNYQREFAQFVLKAKSSPLATNFDLTLYTLVVTNHPYNYVDPVNECIVSTNITPVTAQYFRAEFTQYNAGFGFDGPRIVELDGFGEAPVDLLAGPTNETVTAGQNASFSVTVAGTPPLSYQWYENSTNIPAADNPTATNATLVLTNAQINQSGNTYYVMVSNTSGTSNSSSAVLTVNPVPPVILPSTNDLWDISQGSVVTATSGAHVPYSDIRDMFGGMFSEVGPGATVFNDGQPPGFVHYVEWQTPAPVTVNSFNLFALGDGPQFDNQREFAQFVLKAKSSPLATNFDLTLYTLVVTNHPYNFIDPVNFCLLSTAITPVTAQYFRAEFTQYTAGRGFDGPRIVELDGFGEIPLDVLAGPTNETVTAGQNASFSVTAAGTPPLSYQWYENSTNIPAAGNPTATNATLVLTDVQTNQSGNTYYVTVSNTSGTTNSSSAMLTVNPVPPVIVPSTNDLWDISQGSVVTATSGAHVPYSDIRDMFGGMFSEVGPGATVFNDGQPPGFVHYVDWQTPGPVTVSSFNLFAVGDGAANNYQREFAQFVLKAKSGPLATNYDLTLYTLVVTNHPYNYVDPVNFCVLSTAITPVTAQYFRAEFTQYTAGRGFDGPRVIELDGFGDNPPVVVSGPNSLETYPGSGALFSVVATGTASLGYQWQENMTNIPASVNPTATNATLALTNISLAQSGNIYSVVITNSLGSTNSTNAVLTVLSPGSCFPPPAGIISWWPGERSGIDIYGTNNGTLVGGVTFAPGEVGQAFSLNGTSQYVDVPDSPSLNPTNAITCEAWINPAQFVNSPPIIKKDSPLAGGYTLELNSAGGVLFSVYVNGGWVSTPVIVVPLNQWTHVAGVYNGLNVSIYVNGVLAATASSAGGTILPATNDLQIGHDQFNPTRYFKGLIDEPTLYGVALTAAQIQDIYDADSAGKCASPEISVQPLSQVGYWGGNVTLSVTAAGTGPFTYQWDYNSAPIANATNATLVLGDLQFTNTGSYTVTVGNQFGSQTSAPAVLTVNPAGISIALYAGIDITGTPGLTYGVQYSTNLGNTNDWLGLANLTLSETNELYFDLTPATRSQRFYRVVPGPITIP